MHSERAEFDHQLLVLEPHDITRQAIAGTYKVVLLHLLLMAAAGLWYNVQNGVSS